MMDVLKWLVAATAVTLSGCNEAGPLAQRQAEPQAPAPATPGPIQASSEVPTKPVAPVTPPVSAKPRSPGLEQQPPQTPEKTGDFWAAIAAARKATRNKDHDAAIALFTTALAIAPGHARALAGRGYAALLKGDLAAAGRDLEAALAAARDDKLRAAVYFNLGLLHERTGDLAAAQRSFTLSNELRPTRAAAAKLAESPVCVATVEVLDAPARSYASWQALSDAYPTEAKDMPASEAAAKRRICDAAECGAGADVHELWQHGEETSSSMTVIALETGAGIKVQELGEVDKGSACDDFIHAKIIASTPWLIVEVEEVLCTWEDGDCKDEDEDCDSMVRAYSQSEVTFAVFDPKDLRRVLMVTTPIQAGTEDTPVVTLAVEGDAVHLRGGKCDRVVTPAAAKP